MDPEQIRSLRRKGGFSLEELGRQLGVTGRTVWNWETGRSRPHLHYITQIRNMLGDRPKMTDSATSQQVNPYAAFSTTIIVSPGYPLGLMEIAL